MSIKELLVEEWTGRSCVTVFHGRSCPSLFLSTILPSCAARRNLSYTPIVADLTNGGALERHCYMGFFGSASLLWCGDVSTLGAAAKKTTAGIAAVYTGPHHLMLFCVEKDKELFAAASITNIACDEPVDRDLFLLFARSRGVEAAGEIWELWQKKRGLLSLDEASRLIWYVSALGQKGFKDWFVAWEERLFASEQSLFKLSQYFFARDRAIFAKMWRQVADEYPPEFWVAYWSEQIWQAHMVVASMRNKVKPPVTNRLPFSFLQRDWRKYEPRELVAAHTALYNTDFSLKNGAADTYGIELFVFKFVSGGFAGV